jgi:putative ABC transport system permease protein
MTFFGLVAKNLFRQKTRTGLTVLGISIGIMTVIALGVVADGLRASTGDLLRLGESDFLVAQQGASDLTFSTVTHEEWLALERVPGVARATGVLMHVTRVGSNAFFLVFGVRPEQLAANPPRLVAGELLAPQAADEIVLGARAAEDLGVGVGETIAIDDRPFRVVGVFQTGVRIQDSGGYASLAAVEALAGRSGVVTGVYVAVDPDADPALVAAAIEERVPQLATIGDVSEVGEVDQGMQIIDAANLAISLLAVGIGAIGVMNTMAMSVFERTREIGILRAVGWSGRRILQLIVGESLLLCVISAGVGALLGVLLSRAVLLVGTIQAFLEPQYSPAVFVRAFVVAVVVALAGSAYPAFRAVRLTPMEALRHE